MKDSNKRTNIVGLLVISTLVVVLYLVIVNIVTPIVAIFQISLLLAMGSLYAYCLASLSNDSN